MARKSDLKVALLLDLDNFATGLKKAKTGAVVEGNAINAALSDVANKVAGRFFTVQAALGLAKKGYAEFVAAADRLEKRHQGNEGTAAIARISAAVERMQENFVKAILETDLMRRAVSGLATAAEAGAVALTSWASAASVASAGVNLLGAATITLLDRLSGKVTTVGGALKSAFSALAGTVVPGGGVVNAAIQGAGAYKSAAGQSALDDMAGRLIDQTAEQRAKIDSLVRDMHAESAKDTAKSRAESFSRTGGSVVDAFVSSWEGGFARLSSYFRDFSKEISTSLGFMKQSTVSALGDTFESVAFLGPMLQQVYGQSAEGAKRFQAAQLALVGALAVVKGAMAIAEASDLLTEDPAGAAAKLVAAAGYATAAGLAGYATAQTLSSSGRSPASGGIASSSQFGEERRTVTVIIENAVGGEDFVRREVIPALNAAVRSDVTVLSTSSQSAGVIQPGRDF